MISRTATTTRPSSEFETHLSAVASGRTRCADARRRDRQPGAGPLPAGDHAAADALPRRRRIRTATSWWSATARRFGWCRRCWRAWTAASRSTTTWPTPNAVVLAPITDGRWSCLQWGDADAAVLSRARRAPRRGRAAVSRPDGLTPRRRAGAADRVAVDAERVQRLGCRTVGSVHSAPIRRVVNDGAVAVLQPRQALAALTAHGPFLALRRPTNPGCRVCVRSRVTRPVIPSPVRADGRRRCRNGARSRGSP